MHINYAELKTLNMKFKALQTLIFGYISMIFCYENDIYIPNHFRWTHKSIISRDLFCPQCCKTDSEYTCAEPYSIFTKETTTICCVKQARPYWMFDRYSVLIGDLSIDNQLSTDKTAVTRVASNNRSENYKYYRLKNQVGFLSFFPENLCNFINILSIDLSANNIKNIPDISCLKYLDTLKLSYNKIQYIKASTFSQLPYLRLLFLSHNVISYLEPETFKYRPGSLHLIDLSSNALVSVDITNIVLGYFFDGIDFSYNHVSRITNELNWDGFQEGEEIGGGWIYLYSNNFTHMPILSKVGFRDMHSVFKISFNYRMNVGSNPWVCDCLAFPYINVFIQANLHFQSITGINCATPPLLKGLSMQEIRSDKSVLHQLICNVTSKEKCPPGCYCFDQPSKSRVVVNCSSTARRKMPKVVPDSNNLDIDLSRNIIDIFEYLDYLNRTIKIDLSYNRIAVIDPLLLALENIKIIYIHNNQLTSLVRSVQLRNPCTIWIGNLTLSECKCDMMWIKYWLERQKRLGCPQTSNYITCIKKTEYVDILFIKEQELCPVYNSNTLYVCLSCTVLTVIGIFMFYNKLRYEIYLIIRKRATGFHHSGNNRHIQYDTYVSLNIENDSVIHWVIHVLDSHLRNLGYKICLPPRDFEVAGIQIEQIHSYVSKSQSFIIILSEDYLESHFQAAEWNYIWSIYTTDEAANIIIINFDILKSKKVNDRKLKAFLRLGYCLDFSNFNTRLLIEIENGISRSVHRE